MEHERDEQLCRERLFSDTRCRDLAVLPTETMLIAELENLQEELHCLQKAVGAVQPYVPRNSIGLNIHISLLQYRDGIAHIDRSLQHGSISGKQAHQQKNRLAEIYAGQITDQVCQELRRPVHSPEDTQHRYLVQFRKAAWEYFRTDCTFRQGQLDLAIVCMWSVVDALEDVEEGRVLNAATHRCVRAYP